MNGANLPCGCSLFVISPTLEYTLKELFSEFRYHYFWLALTERRVRIETAFTQTGTEVSRNCTTMIRTKS